MNSWTHETKAAAFGQLISEASTHSSEFFKPMRDGGYSKLRKDVFQQHQELTAHHDPKDLSDYAHVYRKLRPYTTNSKKLNLSLINKPKSLSHAILHANTAKNISGIIEKHGKPLESDVHVYSGTGKFNPGQHLKEGGILHTPAFTSTSLNPSTAHEFLQHDEAREAHVIHFHLPKGYNKGYYVGSKSMVQHEHEMILDKGQKWKLTGHEEVQNHNGDVGKVRKLHIWSVTPHDEHIHEMTYHDHGEIFGDLHKIETKYLDHNHESLSMHKDMVAQHLRLRDHFQGSVTKEQGHAIASYSDESYGLNKSLIKGTKLGENDQKIHDHLNTAFANTKGLPEDVHAYSGLKGLNPEEHFKKSNGVIHLPAHTSASINPQIAHTFTNDYNAKHEDGSHIIHFHLPAGHKHSIYIHSHTYMPQEHEIVIQHGHKWKLTDYDTHTKQVYNFGTGKVEPKTVHVWSVKPHEEDTPK